MKNSKLLLVVALLALVLSMFTACVVEETHTHEYGAWEIVKVPTETDKGTAKRQCATCDDVDEASVPALTDSSWTSTKNEPTHTKKGSVVYTSSYGKVTVELDKTADHEFGELTLTVNPTADEVGKAVKVCPCGEEATVDVPALSDTDTWTVETTAATHTKEGVAVYTSVYGVVEVIIPVVEHTYGAWTIVTKPTLDATGKATRTCACTHVDEVVVPALSDDTVWTVEVTPADHLNEGLAVYTSAYGVVEVVLAKDEAHTYGAWTIVTKPTLDATGKATRTCACTHVDEVVVPALSDDAVWTVEIKTPADHLNEGLAAYTSVYGVVEVVIAKDEAHNAYGAWTIVTNPTLDATGIATRTCACDYVDEVVVPVLTDDSVWTVVSETPADYNNAGEVVYESVYGTATAVVAKLVAPYDNKTYSNVHYDAKNGDFYYKHGAITPDDVWCNAVVTLDANGAGIGTAYPFRGVIEFSIVDVATGKIAMKVTDYDTNDAGEIVINYDEVTVKYGYVDFETGLIVIPHGSSSLFNTMLVLTPYGIGVNSDDAVATSVASAWTNSMAIDYSVIDGASHSIFVHNENVYFGVSFVDANGNVVAANECYNAPYVKVIAKDGSLIEAFAFNGEELVITDKNEGTFSGDLGDIVVSGYGFATVNGVDASYVTISDGVLGVFVDGCYYVVTVDGDAYTAVKPMVTVSFDAGEFASYEAVSVNANVAYTLPVPECDTHTFKGWFYDASFENAVGAEFIPTEDVTLFAYWTEKVVVYLSGVLEGDATVIYLGEGDIIGEYLPEYSIEGAMRFAGWVIIVDGEEVDLPLEAELSIEDSGITIYAKWIETAKYIGTYYGTELYNAGMGNYGNKTITIDADGNITGLKTGTVLSYDAITQVLTWTPNGTDVKIMYFNAELGVLAVPYSNSGTSIDNDFYFFSKQTPSIGKVNAYYAVKAAKTPGDSTRGWYAHLINAETDLGTREVFIYNNYIYTNFTAVDGLGNTITAAELKNSKVLVVKDVDGNIIVSVASMGDSFDAKKDTVDLDAFFGTYVNGDETAILDGTGVISLNGVTGTYVLAVEGSAYQFDVYLNDNSEYYELTLDGDSFVIVKPMVTITYEEGEYASLEDVVVNKNITVELPQLTHEENIFNGWFYDAEFTSPVGNSFAPSADTTVYALWKVKKVVTIVYNNGDDTIEVSYSEGDVVDIEDPIYAKHAFVGWYTTETLDDGSEWTNGCEIYADVTIYAKWTDAYAYYNTYTITRLTDTKLTGTGYTYCYKSYSTGPYIFEIDANGNGLGSSNPFNGAFTVENYNPETGYLEIVFIDSYNNTVVYFGYLDDETGIIITEYITEKGLNQVFFFNPFTTEEVTSSNIANTYWNEGKSRAIQYTYDGVTHSIFVHNDMVYFGVSFTDMDGNPVAAASCKDSSTLLVTDKNGNLIAKFAHDGSSLQAMDGFEGTYAGDNAVIVDGVKTITIDGVAGEYAHVDGVDFTVEAYVNGAYYEVTLDNVNYVAVVVKPMVTITYSCGEYATLEALVANKNIVATLATPTNEAYTFRGWFFDAEYTNAVPAEFIPTEDVTVFAKWAEKVVLTVVYGNGLETETFDYSVGDTINLIVPASTNGLFFEGWYEDAEFATKFTATVISANTTVYCNWTDAVPFTVKQYSEAYAMVYDPETGAWTSSNQGAGSTSSGLIIEADSVDIEITFDWSVSSESNWDALYVYANGQELLNKSSGSGEKSGTITLTLRAGNSLTLYYKKDSGGNKGTDTATITNLTVAGTPVTEA